MTDEAAPPVDLMPLYTSMVANLTEYLVTAKVVFGQREPVKQLNQGVGRANRVVFEPGDPSGKAGSPEPLRNPGGNPRPVGRLGEIATVYCWGYDHDHKNDESAHYAVARALFGQVFRALRNAGFGNLKFGAVEWIVDKMERRFGYECRFTVTFGTAILDANLPTVIATGDATEIDVDEMKGPQP